MQILVITYIFFYGTFITVMLFMHNIVILGLRIFEQTADKNFSYDFHLYLLMLLGTVLFLQVIRSLRASLMLKAGDENGIRKPKNAAWIVLAVAIPLIPIQFFGIVLTVFSLLNLAAIKLLLKRSAVSQQASVEKTLVPA